MTWSTPPAEPTPQRTVAGSAFTLAARSATRLHVGIRRHDHQAVFAQQQGERMRVVERDRRLVRQDRADGRDADREQTGARLLRRDELGEADGAAGARNVDDLDALGEAALLKRLLHGPRRLIEAAARVGRRDDLEPIDLRVSRRGGHRERSQREENGSTACERHPDLLVYRRFHVILGRSASGEPRTSGRGGAPYPARGPRVACGARG